MKSEFELIELLKKKIPLKLRGGIGIGDDAGSLRLETGKVLLASDTVVDGVDFLSAEIKPELAGRKALAVNLSDIAAMGGDAAAFVVNLGIPKKFSEKWILKFYDGMMALAKEYKLACLGGDISKSREFFASISILGKFSAKPVLRSGAKNGDWIGVTGKLGGSILGHHASFEPRVREGKVLAGAGVSAMIDVSDGFLQDLDHILKSSSKGADLEISGFPVSGDAWKLAGKEGALAAFQHALSDGEDFELLFTATDAVKRKLSAGWAKKFPKQTLHWIGKITSAKEKVSWRLHGQAVKVPKFKKQGYVHF